MSKGIVETIIGGAEIAGGIVAGVLTGWTGGGLILATSLIGAGAGMVMTGVGTMLTPGAMKGFATTVRNPTAPWEYVYGRTRSGGTLTYENPWPKPGGGGGGNDQIIDLVITLAAHSCQSIDAVLFDMQRVQIDTTAAPPGAAFGSGTSFTPVQQNINIVSIVRANDVVTVTLGSNIPYLIDGDRVQIAEDGAGTLTAAALIGTFQVAQIISRIGGGIVFTYLSGGLPVSISGHGHVNTLWADYGRTVYFEPLLGTQALGQTFAGMTYGTPLDGNMGDFVKPEHTGGVQGSNAPNPWTANCSQVGKTMVMLRLHYSQKYYQGGLPQISFLMHGKNNILDPRTGNTGYSENSALCIADFLSMPATIGGYGAAYGTEISNPLLIAAANVCDEAVPLAGAVSPPQTEPAYTCNGKFNLDMTRGEILQNMLTSCAGRITFIGGEFAIWPASWRGNDFAIGSNPGGGVTPLPAFNQIAAGPIRWKPTISIRDQYNGIKGTYISQANKWGATDFPPYAQDALHGYTGTTGFEGDANLAADGGERRWKDIQLPFTITASTAQRLAKIELLRSRLWGTGTLVLNMTGYQIAPMDLMLATIPYLGWTAKQLEVSDVRLHIEEVHDGAGPALAVEIDVQEADPNQYEWETKEELSPQGYFQPGIDFIYYATETVPGFTAPYAWKPGYVAPLPGDAVFPEGATGPGNFGLQAVYGVDGQGNATVNLNIQGSAPPNQLSNIGPPQIVCVAGAGGSLATGTYYVGASAVDAGTPPLNTQLSTLVPVTIAAAGGSIAVTVSWPPGANGGGIYMGETSAASGLNLQTTLAAGTTSYIITSFNQSTVGAPDVSFDHFATAWKPVIHGGVWAQQVQGVTANTVTIAGDGMTTNQWAGYTATLLGKLDPTQELPILNMPVASSTASVGDPAEFTLTIGTNSAGVQLPDLTTLLVVGDLIVMRFNATFGAQSFQDLNIANPYYPTGATEIVEAGHLAMVLSGPNAGDVQTISAVSTDVNGNGTILELAAPWTIQPNTGDIVTVVEAVWGPEVQTPVPTASSLSAVSSPSFTNLGNQTWVVIVRTESEDDLSGPDGFAPVREAFLFGSQGTRVIYASTTMLLTDGLVACDTTSGNITFTLLPVDQVPNQVITIQKISADGNTVTILPYQGDVGLGIPADTLPGGATEIVLSDDTLNSTVSLQFNG